MRPAVSTDSLAQSRQPLPETLVLRPTFVVRLVGSASSWLAIWVAVGAGVSLSVAPAYWPTFVVVAGLALAWIGVGWQRRRLRLDRWGFRRRNVTTETKIPWAQVIDVHVGPPIWAEPATPSPRAPRGGTGPDLRVIVRRGDPPHVERLEWRVPLSDKDVDAIIRWIVHYEPETAVNSRLADSSGLSWTSPWRPWRDRHGVWHTRTGADDAVKGLHSSRRLACIERWEISWSSHGDGFRAVAKDAVADVIVDEGPVRPTRAEVLADAEGFVAKYRTHVITARDGPRFQA